MQENAYFPMLHSVFRTAWKQYAPEVHRICLVQQVRRIFHKIFHKSHSSSSVFNGLHARRMHSNNWRLFFVKHGIIWYKWVGNWKTMKNLQFYLFRTQCCLWFTRLAVCNACHRMRFPLYKSKISHTNTSNVMRWSIRRVFCSYLYLVSKLLSDCTLAFSPTNHWS